MIEQILFWPLSDIMRLRYSFSQLNKSDEYRTPGYYVGIILAFLFPIIGITIGLFISSQIPLISIWIIMYVCGCFLEILMESYIPVWYIRLFLVGICVGLTIQQLV